MNADPYNDKNEIRCPHCPFFDPKARSCPHKLSGKKCPTKKEP